MKIQSLNSYVRKEELKLMIYVSMSRNDTNDKKIRKMEIIQMFDIKAGIWVRLCRYKEKNLTKLYWHLYILNVSLCLHYNSQN